MSGTTVLRVAVPSPLRHCLDYLPPDGPLRAWKPGVRVRVPLGRRATVGVLVAVADASDVPPSRLRRAVAVLDREPLLPDELLDLLGWAAAYYHHPIGEVMAASLPAVLRAGRSPAPGDASVWRLSAAGLAVDPASFARAPRQRALLDRLAGGDLGRSDLASTPGDWRRALAALERRGLVQRATVSGPEVEIEAGPALNAAQAGAVAAVDAARGGFAAFLLDGVTGSGKTEVYASLVERVLRAGDQALVLVPEIGLTPQIVARFRARLGRRLAVLHSGLADGERARAWIRARDGGAGVLIGTRSAALVPLARPGLIIVDEEHDASFKQQEGFRYSARDLAVVRAQRAGVPVVLGSATPSLESLHNAREGRYTRLVLPVRAGGASAPGADLVDLRGTRAPEGLSPALESALERGVERGEQSLLFLNRRGYAPALLCHACGVVPACDRCDASLVYHRADGRLRCHHCGVERVVPGSCAACGGTELRALGLGTERLAGVLRRRFPGARIARLDRDATRARGALESTLADVLDGRVDILVGTQMLAKGHHFPDVTLVAIVEADGGLFSADFRGAERMAQQLCQVAGRAGRGAVPGRVLVQTHHPDHPLLRTLVHDGYPAFAHAALAERRAAGLPPHGRLALLRVEAPGPGPARDFAAAARAAGAALAGRDVLVMGPVPAPMERRAGRSRFQVLAESGRREPLHRLLSAWIPAIEALPGARRVRWSVDVDPADLY